MKKRILSLLLALMMVLSLIPTLAFAAGEDNSSRFISPCRITGSTKTAPAAKRWPMSR